MLRNKHVLAAMLITPVLAILGYFVVDFMVAEDPETAREGAHYKLADRSNCRYESGKCTLENGNFRLEVTIDRDDEGALWMRVDSAHPLEGLQAAWAEPGDENARPDALQPRNDNHTQWEGRLSAESLEGRQMQLAAKARGAYYLGEAGNEFVEYRTSFGEDFRR